MLKLALELVDRGMVPDALLRVGARRVVREREQQERAVYGNDARAPRHAEALARWVADMRAAPVALVPDKANEQHYEVPARYYELVLGPARKYSCAYYPDADTSLDQAEQAMLALTCERARLADGQRVLELGCGWGSLSLYMAANWPSSQIVAVSNSHSQREAIAAMAAARGLSNLELITADMNAFEAPLEGGRFDRVVSIEMFEHMRNWEQLLGRVRRWLADEGLFFQHVFAHERFSYPYVDEGPSDWMTRHFFSGGMMPSHALLDELDIPFELVERWRVNGRHYQRTAEDWLARHMDQREAIMALFAEVYGPAEAGRWFQRWRVFYIAVAELFGYADGEAWFVSHNLLAPT